MDNQLRIVYAEILKGYSKIETPHFRGVFLKHLTTFDIAEVDIKYNTFYEKAKNVGILTEKEKLFELEKENIWTNKNNQEIKDFESVVHTLEQSKKKCIVRSEIKIYNDEIERIQKKIIEQKHKRLQLLDLTAESYAIKKTNDYFIFISLYKSNLTEQFFSEEDFEELSDEYFQELIDKYSEKSKSFSNQNLKKIAISSFFVNSFCLCEDDPLKFYGKPIVNLTLHQIELFAQGKVFKRILSENHEKITPDLLENPDKLIEWYHSSENTKKILDKSGENAGGTAIVGATKDELEKMGVDTSNSLDISRELQKHGGNMTFQQIIAAHGG